MGETNKIRNRVVPAFAIFQLLRYSGLWTGSNHRRCIDYLFRNRGSAESNDSIISLKQEYQEHSRTNQEHSRTLKNMKNTQEHEEHSRTLKNTIAFRENISNLYNALS
ncbi:hypothetical protein LXL04_008062 [Taraxacum kok-saghyz]